MNVQIFGRSKSFDTRKAMRFFQERKIAFHFIDLERKGPSLGELKNLAQAVGGLEKLVDEKTRDQELLILWRHLQNEARLEKLSEHPSLLQAPIVRDGRRATVGHAPDTWRAWIREEEG